MKHPVRWLIWIFGGLAALIAIAAGVVFFLVSRLDIRAEIEKAVEDATGRDLTISGEVGVSFYPVLGLRAEEATLANVEGGRAPVLASIGELDVGVEILPLLRREVVVRNLVLAAPKLYLEIDAEGVPNWILQPAPPPEGAPEPAEPSAPAEAPPPFSLRSLRIADGEASLYDARADVSWSVSEADLRTSLVSLDEPVRVEGSVVYNSQQVELNVEVAAPRAVMAGEGTALKASVESALVTAEFDGSASTSSGQIFGRINASGDSLRQLAAWLGAPIEGGFGMESYRIVGRLAAAAWSAPYRSAASRRRSAATPR
jgi:AsmA protein